jgi:hypothetical protein
VPHEQPRGAGPADAGWRSCHEQVAGAQGDGLADGVDEGGDVEHHVRGVGLLDHGSVEPRLQPQPLRARRKLVGRDHGRPEATGRVEGLAEGPLRRLELVLTHRAVVEDAVAEHVVQRLLARDVLAAPPDHHGEFALVVQGVAAQGTDDRLLVCREARGQAQEQGRVVRLLVSALLRVVGVVQTHADDLVRVRQRRQVLHRVRRHRRRCLLPPGRQVRSGSLGPDGVQNVGSEAGGQGVDAAWTLEAQVGLAIQSESDEFHAGWAGEIGW